MGLSEVGVDAVGVGGGELGEGLLPVVGDLSLDEAALGLSLVRGSAGLLGSLGGATVLDVADRQPQQLDGRDIVGEVTAVLGDLAQLIVQRLGRVGGVDDAAQCRRERQERDEPLPGPLPHPHRVGVAHPQGRGREVGQGRRRLPRWRPCGWA